MLAVDGNIHLHYFPSFFQRFSGSSAFREKLDKCYLHRTDKTIHQCCLETVTHGMEGILTKFMKTNRFFFHSTVKHFRFVGTHILLKACWQHVCCAIWKCALVTSLQFVMYIMFTLGCRGSQLGCEYRVHWRSAALGLEGFPQREMACPRRAIKMDVCFQGDTLGHIFPTALAKAWPSRDTARKPAVPPNS